MKNELGDMPAEEFRKYGYEIVDWIADYFEHIDELPVLSQVQPNWLKDNLPTSAPEKGGNVEFVIRLQEEQLSHASSATRCRQFKAFASSSAKSFLPTPSSPVKSNEPATRPLPSKRRSASLTLSFPIRCENITES